MIIGKWAYGKTNESSIDGFGGNHPSERHHLAAGLSVTRLAVFLAMEYACAKNLRLPNYFILGGRRTDAPDEYSLSLALASFN